MVAAHLLAHCQEALCVAEDTAVAFYGAKTLRKFRVERFSGARICGVYIQSMAHCEWERYVNSSSNNINGKSTADASAAVSAKGKVLHVIDDEGNWFVVELDKLRIVASATLHLASNQEGHSYTKPISNAHDTAELHDNEAEKINNNENNSNERDNKSTTSNVVSNKPVIAARRSLTPFASPRIVQAHFCELNHVLHCVLLTTHNIQVIVLRFNSFDNYQNTSVNSANNTNRPTAMVLYSFPRPLQECILAVSRFTGVILLAQRNTKWLRVFRINNDNNINSLHVTHSHHNLHQQEEQPLQPSDSINVRVSDERLLPIFVSSMTCSPVNESIAIGGTRGELLYYPVATDTHHFADHWHHTALTALCFANDGASLFTGAAESIVLMWNLTSYTHKKIACHVWPIQCIVPSCSSPATLLLACGEATLGMVDVLSLRLQHHVEGVEWSCNASCTGLLVEEWMGQTAVVLTGLPHVLRVCDPLTQQSLYSLHISSQMEVFPHVQQEQKHDESKKENTSVTPKNVCGIKFAGLLRGGRVIVTYECFNMNKNSDSNNDNITALPPLLRFWEYNANAHKHLEVQTIYSPHSREVIALEVDKAHGRVFTLSADEIKCWTEVKDDSVNALASPSGRSWRNQSTNFTPTQQTARLSISHDGSLCCVADDCVYVYSIEECLTGVRWPLIRTLTQSIHTNVFDGLTIMSEAHVIVAYDITHVFFWNLFQYSSSCSAVYSCANHTSNSNSDGNRAVGVEFTAMCPYSPSSVVVAQSDLTLVELRCTSMESNATTKNGKKLNTDGIGSVKAHAKLSTQRYSRIEYMSCVNYSYARLAIIDAIRGFRVVELSMRDVSSDKVISTEKDNVQSIMDITSLALTEEGNANDKLGDYNKYRDETSQKSIEQYFNVKHGSIIDTLRKSNNVMKINNKDNNGDTNENELDKEANNFVFNLNYTHSSLQAGENTLRDNNDGDRQLLTSDEQIQFASRLSVANRWLEQMIHEPAYAAPPISSILSSYLQKQSAMNYGNSL